MSSAKFYEQLGTGLPSQGGVIPTSGVNNQRHLNTPGYTNNIIGMNLASNSVYTPIGTYKIKAKTPACMAGNVRAIVWDFTNNVPLIVGQSYTSTVVGGGPTTANINLYCEVEGTIGITNPCQIGVMLYVQGPGFAGSFGLPTSDGNLETYTSLEFETK